MVQRRAARYVTNRYHNTSSVTSMLDHLQWETLESRRTKAQLSMICIQDIKQSHRHPSSKIPLPRLKQNPIKP
ncbi:hypothetical protein DPMN_003223 [Dreissena polymorpha]|uniref:Uncharacterized protein n=1 Tax=Dreissena polymorpha TaxID=45954 RepID=A0A9D4MN14_DREPO|nr:hypothetical protein DPMN_003223 [Dreissena polymorpha]